MLNPLTGTGAAELSRALKQLGVHRVFSLCSDQTNSMFLALAHANIEIIGARHESAAVHMAEGHARATGEPAVALLGGGPGFVNGVAGIAVAQAASVPLVVIAGQPPLRTRERNGHQIVYQADIVRSLTKWSQEVASPDLVAEFVARGFHIALAGKPGPVCISIPMDVADGVVTEAAAGYRVRSPVRDVSAQIPVSGVALAAALDILNCAVRPVLLVGGTAWGKLDPRPLRECVQKLAIPTFTFEVARGMLPDDGEICFGYGHPQYNKVFHEIKTADTLILIGAELGLHTSDARKNMLAPDARVIQVHADATQIGLGRASDAAILGDLASILRALADGLKPQAAAAQSPWLTHIRKQYTREREAWKSRHERHCENNPSIHPLRVHESLARYCSGDIRLSIDGGDFANWARVFFQARTPGYWLDKTEMGNIGVSIPVGIGAQIARPARQTWVLIGDGGFGFYGMELSLAVERKLPIKVIIGNDQSWGVERRLQLAHYGRTVATDLPYIRYDLIARELGAKPLFADNPADLDSAVDELIECDGPAVLNVMIQRDAGRLSDERMTRARI